jgi:hypothetical protein
MVLALYLFLCTVSAHFEIVYPGWRGDTLHTNQQWKFPCGGLGVTTNRTKWPIDGGGVIVIPGWNAGHPTSFWYVNMGFGNDPPNMTNIVLPVFQSTGPSANPFPGEFCLPDLPLPKNTTVKPGDNATLQLIQVALHGADLYNCADITFVERGQEDPIPAAMCHNSSDIGFNLVFTTTSNAFRALVVPTIGLAAIGVGAAMFFI